MNLSKLATSYATLLKDGSYEADDNPFVIAGECVDHHKRNSTIGNLDELSYLDLLEMRADNDNSAGLGEGVGSEEYLAEISDVRETLLDGSNGECRAPPTNHPGKPDCLIYGGTWKDVEALFTDFQTVISEPKRKNESDRIGQTSFNGTQLVNKLIKHSPSSEKDGPAFLQGQLMAGRRSNKAVLSNRMMVFDLDSGEDLGPIRERLLDMGIFAVIYSTFSHQTTSTAINAKDVAVTLGTTIEELGSSISADLVQRYLSVKAKLLPTIAMTASGAEIERMENGFSYKFQHAPIPKYRIVTFLEDDFNPGAEGRFDVDQGARVWSQKYKAVADALKLSFDKSCTDIARLFYYPTHKRTGQYHTEIVVGDFLKLSKFKVTTDEPKPIAKTLVTTESRVEPWIWHFCKDFSQSFEFGAFMAQHFGDHRTTAETGKVTVQCPFNDFHSDPDNGNDVGFIAIDAGASTNDGGHFAAKCQHDHCSHQKRQNFLAKTIADLKNADAFDGIQMLLDFVPDVVVDGIDTAKLKDKWKGHDLENVTSTTIGRAELPYGFAVGRTGEIGRWEERTDGGKKRNIFSPVCGYFEVLGKARTADGNDWSLVIQFDDPDGRKKQHRISDKALVTDAKAVRAELVGSGLRVFLSEVKHFDHLLDLVKTDHRLLVAKSPGWQSDDIFVLPDGISVGGDGNTEIILDGAMVEMVSGTLEGSIAVMNSAVHSGVAHWSLAPMFGVAGCLVDYLGIDSCSIALTGATSKGKTTALSIAASVWGNPDAKGGNSMLTSLSGTSNSYEALLQRSNGIGFFGDEMQHMDDGKAFQQLVFSTSQGEGKGRLRQDGSERGKRRWRTFAIFTGEIGVAQKVNREGAKAAGGLSARLVDFDVSHAPDASRQCLTDLSARSQHFGHLGKAFASWLADHESREHLKPKMDEYAVEIAGAQADTLEKRAARVFALLRLAGEILQRASLIDRSVDIAAFIKRVRSEHTPENIRHIDVAIETLRANIAAKWEVSVHPLIPDPDDRRYGKADAWRENDVPGGRVFIPRDKLVEMAGGSIKLNEIVKALKGLPVPEHCRKGRGMWEGVIQMKGKNTIHEELPETGGKIAHYRIDMSFFRGRGLDDHLEDNRA